MSMESASCSLERDILDSFFFCSGYRHQEFGGLLRIGQPAAQISHLLQLKPITVVQNAILEGTPSGLGGMQCSLSKP